MRLLSVRFWVGAIAPQTNGAARIRKETKTGSVRYFTMTARLRKLLEGRVINLLADDLVFTSLLGNPIGYDANHKIPLQVQDRFGFGLILLDALK